jgi:DNA-directed RNA polymerase sigma subunit (sigma70/sigma32)
VINMSWKDILKKYEPSKKAKELAEKIKILNAKIRGAHERLSRQVSIDPTMRSIESRKLIKVLENLAKEQEDLMCGGEEE